MEQCGQIVTISRPVAKPSPFVKCDYCDKDFVTKGNKRRHESKFHGVIKKSRNIENAEKPIDDSLVCTFCDKVFANVYNKQLHELRLHGVKSEPRPCSDGQTVVKCKHCNVNFNTLNHYREHLLGTHQIETRKTHHKFASEEEFLLWKNTLELDVGVNYTAHSGMKNCSDGIKQIFYCRRSGVLRTTNPTKDMRAEKSQGTCKIGSYCTSSMEIVKIDGKILVTFYFDHQDHDLGPSSLAHMHLPKSEKDKIAGMVTQGMDHGKILDQVRQASGGNRMSFLEKKDIRNICVSYGLTQSQSHQTESQVKEYKQKLMNNILQLGPKIQETEDLQVLKTVDSHLSEICDILDAGKSYDNNDKLPVDASTLLEPGNKKYAIQDHLYSTRKRKHDD